MALDAQKQVELFAEFIESNCKNQITDIAQKGGRSILIDFLELSKYNFELAEQLLHEPEEILKAAEIALESFDMPKNTRIRLYNIPKSHTMMVRDIRSEHLGRLQVFEGIVRQSSDVRPQVVSARFECPSCGNTITILQVDTKFKEPTRCTCSRRGKFRLLSKDLVDAQRLVIEEAPESLEGGEQPKRLSVFLREDLVEPKMEKKTTPGSKVRVMGIIKEVPISLKTGAQSVRYDIAAEANYIEPIEQTYEEIEIAPEDEAEIRQLAKDPRLYEKLSNSIAPTVFGYDDIKEALVLQVMGGVRKVKEDGTKTRGDMHVLLVGDPGSAKSTILMYMSKMAPKGRYIAGKGSSGVGLTASIVKDEFLRGWALEAGAMVLANGGFAMIDEMDKMLPEDRDALHEALEQQRITIHKANIQVTLKAETTVLAAANPKLGRFDPYQPIASQIELPPTLINRFDLIFPIRDVPNKERDEKIASHVLNLHKDPESIKPEIPIKLMKKYIAYARQKVNPRLTEAAVDEIKNFYISLRNSNSPTTSDELKPIPISARQLEALVRLSEGSARARLHDKVAREDARRAIKLLRHCLEQVGFDQETGQIDIDMISTGITTAQRSKIVLIRDIINELEKKIGKSIPIQEIMAEASTRGLDESKVEEVIDKMKRDGLVFEPKRGFLSKI